MKINQHNSTIGVLTLQVVITTLLLISQLTQGASLVAMAGPAVGVVVMTALLFAYLRGWRGARLTVVLITSLLAGALMPEPYVSSQPAFSILVPPVLALILTTPIWVIVSTLIVVSGLVVRAGFQGVYTEPMNLLGLSAIIGGMILARLIADTAQQSAQESAVRAEQERVRAEQRAAELDEATGLLESEVEQQRSLLNLVTTLETPVVQLAEHVLFAPVVGRLDARRADMLMSRLLSAVHTQSCRTMIIDIAGVSMVDSEVAEALVKTVRGLQLLGCEVVVSGISAQVATAMVQLNSSLGSIRTVRSPEEALARAVAR